MKSTEVLSREHRIIVRVLDILERMSEEAAGENKLDKRFSTKVISFFREYVDRCHHGKEEHLFFPGGSVSLRGLLQKRREGIFFGTGSGHHDAGNNLADLYTHLKLKPEEGAPRSHIGLHIYLNAIRVDFDGYFFYLDLNNDDQENAWAIEALLELGIPEQFIRCDKSKFLPII